MQDYINCYSCGCITDERFMCLTCQHRFNACTQCGRPSGDDPLCPQCRCEMAERYEKESETPNTPVEEECQAWIEVDGQRVTPDDVRRMANMLQKTRWAWILSGIAENKAQQLIRRLEHELSDCGDAPTYSITPKGYELLRDMAV